ncbi:Dipeptidyl peptidase 3 like protein [Argiope bruennichi]|uniref:Dipeptidyl peptidase 3 n=1 Tax=Argiope bruennichi TaxID=94029 RepID=A0A8T0EJD4_ARGBR|nr:Dipeptidyl peptidase 3 like protein [Argiope bruennichi]
MSDYFIPNNTPFILLECEEAFNQLSEQEKLYSHYLSRASWLGSLIISLQTSIESPLIFSMLHRLFQFQSVEELKAAALEVCNVNEDEFMSFLVYTCGIFASFGNYKGFGDTKFIPDLEKEKFEKIIRASKFAECQPQDVEILLSRCLESIYSLQDKERQLGFPYVGTTTYLSKNFTEEDNKIVTDFLKKKNIEVYNSRLFKTSDESGMSCYEIRLASVLKTEDAEEKELLISESVNSHKFIVTRGDYSKLLKLVNHNLLLAKDYAGNENEVQMIEKYIQSFRTGSLDAHKDGSRFWVKDKEPIIETYIGFIETYKDPTGMRGEFEGFVAMVNKPMSAKFAELVKAAEDLLPLLPWPSAYEKDKFLQPDFSSLDLLTFASNDVPIGINIPNYDEIKQSEGFKNVTLGNAIRARARKPPNYLSKSDQELYMLYRIPALELQTGLHELLGHGSGKLFQKDKDGKLNFDSECVLHLETNQKVTSWYEEGENYNSVFGSVSSPYEECRAECVGLYLSTVPDVLRIFGLEGTEADDAMYVNWIDVVFAGLEALKMYDPKTGSWLQAHGQAAYVILQVLLKCEGDFVKVEKIKGEDGNPDLLFTMDRNKILSHGKPCIGEFLKKLQLYKSTADAASAKGMFDMYSAVTSEEAYPFLEYREIVLARKRPRRIFVQSNTFLSDGEVTLKNYESSPKGLIQSYIERYQDGSIHKTLLELWEKDKCHFT